jgi:uncharacterized protein YbaR (Trm112 family)
MEQYLFALGPLHGWTTVSLRYANVYGPRQNPAGEAGVVAIFCHRLLDGQPCLINGDGKQTRDYTYVTDVAAANLAALERPRVTGGLNIGTGMETTVNELHERLGRTAGRDVAPVPAPARPGEQRRSCLDAARAARELGWRPRCRWTRAGPHLPFFKKERSHDRRRAARHSGLPRLQGRSPVRRHRIICPACRKAYPIRDGSRHADRRGRALGPDQVTAVILAGGQGTRLRPLTYDRPKPIVPLLNIPFLAYQLALLARHGVRDVVLSCSYMVDAVRAAMGDGAAWGCGSRTPSRPSPWAPPAACGTRWSRSAISCWS